MAVPDLEDYLKSLMASPRLGHQVVFHKTLPPVSPRWGQPAQPWPEKITQTIRAAGLRQLYCHQTEAIDFIRARQSVVVSTPTASGKTLTYNLPVLENCHRNPESRALYVFPLKALAQDQRRAFERLTGCWGRAAPQVAIYDGDTTAWQRRKIRERPPNVLITNPEMLHLALIPYHTRWARFWAGLDLVVIDEIHTYRGVMGSHMAQVFRRLRRIGSHYGAAPTFVLCSATVANPKQLAEALIGLEVRSVTRTGAPRGTRHIVLIDPVSGTAQTAIQLLKAALFRRLRTIVYTQSRKLAELIALWAARRSTSVADRISAYRSGFTPQERRHIEGRLADGDLLAVISTSALELGIDIGDLDLCLLVGYPGTMIATWQRGGRVGRSGRASALILIAGEDALDQYFVRNPEELLSRPPEAAVINPYNAGVLARHLECAAAELPLQSSEPFMVPGPVRSMANDLEKTGVLLRSATGETLFASRKLPQRRVDLRGTGTRFAIVCAHTGEARGEIDGYRAYRETHPGAIYLHRGHTYRVEVLDDETRTIRVIPSQVGYYTRVRTRKTTEIIAVAARQTVGDAEAFTGRLRITEQVTGYETLSLRTRSRLTVVPLDLPAQVFETEGLWFTVPRAVRQATVANQEHLMGGIHAIEHALIGIFPLLILADRNDLGGIATPFHPQVGETAIFIYDAVPGGAGLTRQAFEDFRLLLETGLKTIQGCPCETGCPSCVHSPKCGSGNRPVDKAAAVSVLEALLPHPGSARQRRTPPAIRETPPEATRTALAHRRPRTHFGVFDLETQRSAEEVGGWHRADRMRLSCGVLYDSRTDAFQEYSEDQAPQFISHLQRLKLVIGFNIKRFDYRVLSRYTAFDFRTLPTLDLLESVHAHLGYRVSLANLAAETLKAPKTADGLQALRWWKAGRIRELLDYCRTDVALTRDLFLFGQKNGYLLFKNKAGHAVRIPVQW